MTINRENLFSEVKRGYGLSRLENALWTLLFVFPLLFCSIFVCGAVLLSIIFGLLLAVTLIFAKWKGRQLGRAVLPGMVIGFLAYLVPFAWVWLLPAADPILNFAISALAGAAASLAIIQFGKSRGILSPWYIIATSLVVALTGCMSCPMLGWLAILGLAAGVTIASGFALFGFKG